MRAAAALLRTCRGTSTLPIAPIARELRAGSGAAHPRTASNGAIVCHRWNSRARKDWCAPAPSRVHAHAGMHTRANPRGHDGYHGGEHAHSHGTTSVDAPHSSADEHAGHSHRLPLTADPVLRASTHTVLVVGMLSDASLVAIKGAAGMLTGSSALLSDAIHSAADMLMSGLTMVATRVASVGPDADHPYGHGRFDSLGALGVAAALTGAGVGIGWRAAVTVRDMLQGLPVSPMAEALAHLPVDALTDPSFAAMAVGACLASVGIKEVVYHWTMHVGMKVRSAALIANAWHHRADSLSSLVAAVGVGGAFFGVPMLDPVAAIVVAGMITKAGVEIGYRSVQELMDEKLDHDVIALATKLARSREDVLAVSRVRARRMGPSVLIDMEVSLDPNVTVSHAHVIADAIRHAVFAERPEVTECLVTALPAGNASWSKPPLASSVTMATAAPPHVSVRRAA